MKNVKSIVYSPVKREAYITVQKPQILVTGDYTSQITETEFSVFIGDHPTPIEIKDYTNNSLNGYVLIPKEDGVESRLIYSSKGTQARVFGDPCSLDELEDFSFCISSKDLFREACLRLGSLEYSVAIGLLKYMKLIGMDESHCNTSRLEFKYDS